MKTLDRATCLMVALVLTFAARAIPEWGFLTRAFVDASGGRATGAAVELFGHCMLLLVAAALCLAAPRRSGLVIGPIRENWRRVLLINGAPIVIAALVYPNLPERPFAGASVGMWTISPLGQDLMFAGFLYGFVGCSLPGHVHRLVPVDKALLVTAGLFAFYHLPNLGSDMSAGFVGFQMLYTGLGAVLFGLSRQWTGSMLYGLVPHCANNAIAAMCS